MCQFHNVMRCFVGLGREKKKLCTQRFHSSGLGECMCIHLAARFCNYRWQAEVLKVCLSLCVCHPDRMAAGWGGEEKKRAKKKKNCEVEEKSSSGGDAADINEDALTSHCESTGKVNKHLGGNLTD